MNPCKNCSRRKFLGGLLSAGGVVSGIVPVAAWAEDPPLPDLNRVLPLRISDFPSLAKEGGSVMLTFDGEATVLYIIRGAGDIVHVMNPTCPHQGCRVDKYDAVSSQTTCPCHGSAFANDGALINGPATEGLRRYPSRFSQGVLEVEPPEFEFGISRITPVRTAGGAARLALSFPTKSRAAYRFRRGTDPGGSFLPVSFSVERDGPLNQTQVTGDGEVWTVHVDAAGPRAFFRLELMVFEIG
jgi:nitrite reductase/ring-hydroxylating ferredoxin subunit